MSEANRLEVNWTSGLKQTLENVSANQIVVIQEPPHGKGRMEGVLSKSLK
ncbi:TPA: hypothetical protein EYP66_19250 [Candidatus Poribacteria bacterium]|nr:hypothetical protein [Candidatus Poribacteria bacterium]